MLPLNETEPKRAPYVVRVRARNGWLITGLAEETPSRIASTPPPTR